MFQKSFTYLLTLILSISLMFFISCGTGESIYLQDCEVIKIDDDLSNGVVWKFYQRQFGDPNYGTYQNQMCGVACTSMWLRYLRYNDNLARQKQFNTNARYFDYTMPNLYGMAKYYIDNSSYISDATMGYPINEDRWFGDEEQDGKKHGLTPNEIVACLNRFCSDGYRDGFINKRDIELWTRPNIFFEWKYLNAPPPNEDLDTIYKSLLLEEKQPIILGFRNWHENGVDHVVLCYGMYIPYWSRPKNGTFLDKNFNWEKKKDELIIYVLDPAWERDVKSMNTSLRLDWYLQYAARCAILNSSYKNVSYTWPSK